MASATAVARPVAVKNGPVAVKNGTERQASVHNIRPLQDVFESNAEWPAGLGSTLQRGTGRRRAEAWVPSAAEAGLVPFPAIPHAVAGVQPELSAAGDRDRAEDMKRHCAAPIPRLQTSQDAGEAEVTEPAQAAHSRLWHCGRCVTAQVPFSPRDLGPLARVQPRGRGRLGSRVSDALQR